MINSCWNEYGIFLKDFQRIEKPNGCLSVGFFYPLEIIFDFVRLLHRVVLFRNYLELLLAVKDSRVQVICDVIRFCSLWARRSQRFLACSIFLMPVVVNAQSSTPLLLERASIRQRDANPI